MLTTGCSISILRPTTVLTTWVTESYPNASQEPGTARKEAQEKAAEKARVNLMNQAGNLHAANGMTVNQLMTQNTALRQEVLQTIRVNADQYNHVSPEQQLVTVQLTIPESRIMRTVNKSIGQ